MLVGWKKTIILILALGCFLFALWIAAYNIRYHFFPVPYEIVATGKLPYEDKSVNEVRMSIVSSALDEWPSFPPEITSVLYRIDFRDQIAVVIENQVHKPYLPSGPQIRRVIDISNDRIHIESLLYKSPNYETSTSAETYDFVILSFRKRDPWADEMDFKLFNDEQQADYVRAKIR